MPFGPTGRFPRGKLDQHDEGELAMGVFIYRGEVRLEFGKPVAWLALGPDDADALAKLLTQKAAEARKKQQ